MRTPTEAPDAAPTRPDRRAVRRRETKAEIVAAAWDLVREHGLAGVGMRDLGERVGTKAQSIYSYFASKNEIYDAMFHEGYLDFAAIMADVHDPRPAAWESADDVRAEACRVAHEFFQFCTSDPVRQQLLFQRTIPDFVPSADSYAVALDAHDAAAARIATFGVTDPAAIDLWTAVLTGLIDQQISNDPGGDRWERIIDRAVDMVLREIAPHIFEPTTGRSQ